MGKIKRQGFSLAWLNIFALVLILSLIGCAGTAKLQQDPGPPWDKIKAVAMRSPIVDSKCYVTTIKHPDFTYLFVHCPGDGSIALFRAYKSGIVGVCAMPVQNGTYDFMAINLSTKEVMLISKEEATEAAFNHFKLLVEKGLL